MQNIFDVFDKYKDYTNGTTSSIAFVIYILTVIAMWRIFSKANEAGWKSLIPIYNFYIFCKIIHYPFWLFLVMIVLIFIPVLWGLLLILIIYTAIALNTKLSHRFGHGFLFALGLMFFNTLFLLILGFGPSKYHK